MREFCILGHSNATLGILFDLLLATYDDDLRVTIVSNVVVPSTQPYAFEDAPNLELVELMSEEWDGEHPGGVILGVNLNATKRIVFDFFLKSHGIREEDYLTLIHPSAVVSRQVQLGHGVILGPGSVVAPYARLENLATFNRNVSIGHHTHIGKGVTVHPGCNIAGNCDVGDYVTIGIGTNVVDGVEIGENTVIGAGSLVTKSIPPDVLAYGVPARVVREDPAGT